MQRVLVSTLLCLTTFVAFAEPVVMPGDRGRPAVGGFAPPAAAAPASASAAAPAPTPLPSITAPSNTPAPPLALALKAAQAIAEACRQYPLGVAIVDAVGTPKIVYVPDGSQGWHGYSAVRKAWTAVSYQAPTIQLAERVKTDAAMQARIRADNNLMAFAGGRPWMSHGAVIGGIAVSGAEPGGHDDECLLLGLGKVRAELAAAGSSVP